MHQYIGLDVGTTSITALLLDVDTGRVSDSLTVSNDSETTTDSDARAGRSEWDADTMANQALNLIGDLVGRTSPLTVEGIGVTGQQHGMVLISKRNEAMADFIGWQDRRCLETHENGHSYIDTMLLRADGAFSRSEYLPARGNMGATLYWLSKNGQLPAGASPSFISDYIVSRLTGIRPVTDPTNASGSGVLDVITRKWNRDLLERLALAEVNLPELKQPCTWAGTLTDSMASMTGLPGGTPVTVASGDNQVSYAGSVADYPDSVLVNIGTGGQISVFSTEPVRIPGLLVRPYLNKGFLLVGAGMTGGRSYAVLERFIADVGRSVFEADATGSVFQKLNDLARAIPVGSDRLNFEPIFTGSLADPARRGKLEGISDNNLTVGHMARSLLEGMGTQFQAMYTEMLSAGVQARHKLIGAGNGIRRNGLLCRILSSRFDLPMRVVRHTEEAAFGAAMIAAVADSAFEDIESAGKSCIDYESPPD